MLRIGQRTQPVNAIRGHAAEFGVVAAKGITKVEELLGQIARDASMPQAARDMLAFLGDRVTQLDAEVKARLLNLLERKPRQLVAVAGAYSDLARSE